MGAELRVYRRRIKSVESTKKITKAMELIAASRIVKAQARMNSAKPYAKELSEALARLSGDPTLAHPMLTGVENPRRAGILLVTSDRGLAGGYNANAIKTANELASRLTDDGKDVDRYVIGRKGVAYYRFRRVDLAGSWTGFSEQPKFADARGATEAVVAALSATSEGEVDDGKPGIDELWVVYTRFVNSVTQTPTATQVSPVNAATEESGDAGESGASADSDDAGDKKDSATQYEFEPEPAGLVAALVPRYISSRIFSALLESAASESAARRRAMKSASDNATDLIKTYTRLANQARQAEITQEISEIVGGADALAAAGSEE
ncbi:MAG: F-type H+-transporting ATPase subunit gamma [Pseudonocardiales bacterium]|jgi:F-type H+-transporting ATPase subunit gamma|nr:F-type H+-transporting ATPase subunit gamma [Pseudonocardiales bacterium]MDT4923708.1 F-type H+-transporting ATPase subunit gamma [Pseudonocardiales bacterium]